MIWGPFATFAKPKICVPTNRSEFGTPGQSLYSSTQLTSDLRRHGISGRLDSVQPAQGTSETVKSGGPKRGDMSIVAICGAVLAPFSRGERHCAVENLLDFPEIYLRIDYLGIVFAAGRRRTDRRRAHLAVASQQPLHSLSPTSPT